jgi:hypothetical protein
MARIELGKKRVHKYFRQWKHTTPCAAYNLMSLTQFIDKGCLMSGNRESIVVHLKFDIKINTSRGSIFAIYFRRIVVDTGSGSIAVQKWNKQLCCIEGLGIVVKMLLGQLRRC